jgi:hypothetical protein
MFLCGCSADLLRRMLARVPETRPRAADILQHPWLASTCAGIEARDVSAEALEEGEVVDDSAVAVAAAPPSAPGVSPAPIIASIPCVSDKFAGTFEARSVELEESKLVGLDSCRMPVRTLYNLREVIARAARSTMYRAENACTLIVVCFVL